MRCAQISFRQDDATGAAPLPRVDEDAALIVVCRGARLREAGREGVVAGLDRDLVRSEVAGARGGALARAARAALRQRERELNLLARGAVQENRAPDRVTLSDQRGSGANRVKHDFRGDRACCHC